MANWSNTPRGGALCPKAYFHDCAWLTQGPIEFFLGGLDFVEISQDGDLETALTGLKGKVLSGWAIVVNKARPKGDGGGGRGGFGGGRGGWGGGAGRRAGGRRDS